jgi:predicted permease
MLRYGMRNPADRLRDGGARGGAGGREQPRLRNGLVVTQIALALVLLVGSGLMLRSFMALRAVDAGFEPDNVLTARIAVPTAELGEPLAVQQFYTQIKDRLEAQPGVSAVGLVSAMPLGGSGMSYTSIEVEDHPRGEGELPVFASWLLAGPGYFDAMGIDVRRGRGFDAGDGGSGFRAVVVSEAYAEKYWPGADAIGRRIRFGAQNEDWYEVVGIVDNVRQNQIEEVEQEMIYFPLLTEAGGQLNVVRGVDVVVRTAGDPLVLASALRGHIRELNARIPIANVRTGGEVFGGAAARTSFTAAMLGAASGIALLLGLVGIYGVISYVVTQRTREIGVRMALGASTGTVRGMVVKQGLVLGAIGVALGLIAAVPLSSLMESLLYGVLPVDPATYALVAVALIGVSVVASLIPALRAAAVDPGRALRAE